MKLVTSTVLLSLVALHGAKEVGGGHMVSKRQTVIEVGPLTNFAELFGGVVSLFGELATTGGDFIQAQVRAARPLMESVADISDTVQRSGFVRALQESAGTVVENAPTVIGGSVNLTSNTLQTLDTVGRILDGRSNVQ